MLVLVTQVSLNSVIRKEKVTGKSNTVLLLYSDTLLCIIRDISQLVGIKQLQDHYLIYLKGF